MSEEYTPKIGVLTVDEAEKPDAARLVYNTAARIADSLNIVIEADEIKTPDQSAEMLSSMIKRGKNTIVTVGSASGRSAEVLSEAHPRVTFITVGHQPAPEKLNMRGVPIEGDQLEDMFEATLREVLDVGEPSIWQGVRQRFLGQGSGALIIPVLSIILALAIGAIFIAAFDPVVWEAFGFGFFNGISTAFSQVAQAYIALLEGSFGNPVEIIQGLQVYFETGNDRDFAREIRPLLDSLRISTPYVFTGLSVALAFRCGLFNIGAEGQYFLGGLFSTFIGYAITGLPIFIHLPLAVLAGFLGGALWAAIAGFLKAYTGAHEVITTIMLNYIAFRLADFLLQVNGPMARPNDGRPVSPEVLPTSWLPQLFPNNSSISINLGAVIALAIVFAVSYLLFRTTLGFEFRTVGANPTAARTVGISVKRSYVYVMALSGGLAGLAGAHDILGVTRFMPNAFQSGYGFDAIALALLGRNNPVGVLLAALLFGFLRAGAQRMQTVGVPIDIIGIIQGLIIVFIAAPEVVRLVYRLRKGIGADQGEIFTRGWGGA